MECNNPILHSTPVLLIVKVCLNGRCWLATSGFVHVLNLLKNGTLRKLSCISTFHY